MAVLTYLRRILESLDHPDMINLILHYLLALPDMANAQPAPTKNAVSAARKRKSMDLATMMAAKAEPTATPVLFSLVDLILACLKSRSQQTIYVTLQLVSTILRRHHRYAVMTLVRTGLVPGPDSHRTVGAHEQDVEFFMSMAGVIGGQDNFDEVYDGILRDVVTRLESHPCSLKLIAPKVSTNNHELPAIPDSLPGAPRDVPVHSIRPDDPLLSTILDRLETFFVNPVDANLSLTETVLDLATCGFVSLEGWALRHPDRYTFDGDASPTSTTADGASELAEDAQPSDSKMKCRRRPNWTNLPRLVLVVQTLVDQVSAYRQTIPRFDDLLQQRREAFQTANSAVTPVASRSKSSAGNGLGTPAMDRRSIDDPVGESPARPSVLEGIAQRLLSELGTPSRSASPRGRKDAGRGSFATPNGTNNDNGNGNSNAVSGGYGFATPTSTKPIPIAPKEFPLNVDYNTPSKYSSSVARSYSPNSQGQRTEPASWDGRDGLVASQMAAFQAVDRQILARRIGIPATPDAVKPIPLNFNKAAPAASETPENTDGSEVGDGSSALPSENGDLAPAPEETTATVSHVLTNTIILQSFLFEIAALLQARAGLFDEVRFA